MILFAIFCALQIADGLLTDYGIRKGGSEGWAPTLWLMSKIGVRPTLIATKGGLIAMVLVAGYPETATGFLCGVYAIVVIWNVRQVR
jgi:hypothetical protein